MICRSAAAGIFALVLASVPLQRVGSPNSFPANNLFSIPVSPTVVSTIARRDEQLVLLALWRGAARWHSSGGHRHESGGIGQDGRINVLLEFGDTSVDLSFDPNAHTAVIQGRTNRIPSNANVLLIDGVGQGGKGQLVKAFYFDPGDANTALRAGSLAPLFGRSAEIVDFLQCD